MIAACGGRGPLDTDIATYDAPGIPGDDAGALAADSGASGPRDAGATTGSDAGALPTIPGFPTIPGLPTLPGLNIDAGPLGACAACAQQMCGTQVDACITSPTCVEEGFCDLMTCLGGGTTTGGTGLGGFDISCFDTCGSDQTASQELSSALLCVVGSCGSSCLSAIGSLGSLGATSSPAASSGGLIPVANTK